MNVRRYAAILPEPGKARHWRAKIGALADPLLPVLLDFSDLIVLAMIPNLRLNEGKAGLILGELVRRDDQAPRDRLSAAEEREIVTGRSEHLRRSYWGAYVAVIRDPGTAITVFRAPLGDLPAYSWRSPYGLMITSDVELLRQLGGHDPDVDWIGVAEHLVAGDLRRPRTCLAGVTELGGGSEGFWRDSHWHVVERWSPWTAVPEHPLKCDPQEVSVHLGATIRRSVAASTARRQHPLVLLSGGLDSSIVAASLVAGGRSAHALTMVTRDAGGDERRYAASTAASLKMSLSTTHRDIATVDVTRSLASGLPRPIEKSFAQATHAATRTLARDFGVDCIVHGGGGDNVFCSLQSASPAADRLLVRGPDGRFWKVCAEIAGLAQVSLLRVAQRAFLRALHRRRPYRFPADQTMLTPQAIIDAAGATEHPWLRMPTKGFPGSAAHIGLIVAAQSLVQSPDPNLPVPWIAPLITQPVVEACVAISSWAWYDRGRNRAPTRYAFSDRLPAEIVWRRSKGAMDSFIVELFEANRPTLSAMLLDGELSARGLIDRDAVRAVLLERGPTRGQDYARIMRLADVEAWVRSWR